MSDMQKSTAGPQLSSGPLIVGAALVAAGALLAAAGWAVSGVHVVTATRRWIRDMEVPPGEIARMKWAQARNAAAAGTQAWQSGVPAHNGASAGKAART
jgi:hypothetical protein